MPKVILICGRICSGKTTYAGQLCRRDRAVLLSIDEIMLAVFGQHCGDMHDEYADRVRKYLLDKSTELIGNGIDVILDWGFWTKQGRDTARSFFEERGICTEFHYIEIDDKTWKAQLKKRNAAVLENEALAYFVDENLAEKCADRFEQPSRDEIDIWVTDF